MKYGLKNRVRIGLVVLSFCLLCPVLYGQNPSQILTEISTQTTSAATIIKQIFATIAWIFLGLGIVMIIYSAIVDSQRLKFGIIAFLAAALILAVGYGVGLF